MAKQNAPKGAAETQSALSKQEDFILKYKNFFIGAVVALFSLDYSSGIMTTSTLLPALRSWRAKAAMLSGVWALTMSRMPV